MENYLRDLVDAFVSGLD